MRQLNYVVLVLILTTLMSGGCATIKRYDVELPLNLEVISKTEAVEATLDIYDINKQCESVYQGTVNLNKSVTELGIAAGRLSYLVVGFASSSFWGNSSGYISYKFTLLPRKDYRYEIQATYIDDIYHVVVTEVNQKTGEKREKKDGELNACR